MGDLKFLNWIDKHKKKLIFVCWVMLISESIIVIEEVAQGKFEMFGLSFWTFSLMFTNWVWVRYVFQDDK